MNDLTKEDYIDDIHNRYNIYIEKLENENKRLLEMLVNYHQYHSKPPPMIFCKECPNINKKLLGIDNK